MTSPVANPDIQLPLIWDSIPASKTKLKKCANNPRHSWHNEAHFLINAKLNPRWFRKDLVPKAIDRSFKFEYFTGALRFLTRVAEMNEKRREYPRLSYENDRVTIECHSRSGLTLRQIKMAKLCDRLAKELGEQPLGSWEKTIEDETFEQQKKDKCILHEAALEEARARRQEKQKRIFERNERMRRLGEECKRALGPEEQIFTWFQWKKAGRDREDLEHGEADVDEKENRGNWRPQISSLMALADLSCSTFARPRLDDRKGEEEVSQTHNDGIPQSLRGGEMMSDEKSQEHKMKDMIESITLKLRNATPVVPICRVVDTYMHSGFKVLKDNSKIMKADGRIVETES